MMRLHVRKSDILPIGVHLVGRRFVTENNWREFEWKRQLNPLIGDFQYPPAKSR